MANQYIYNLTDSWTNAATTYDAIKMTAVDTASNAASNLLTLQTSDGVTATTRFAVSKTGLVSLSAGTAAAPAIRSSASTGTGIYFSGNNLLFSADGANRMGLDGVHNITVSAISALQWANSGGSIGGTVDLIALRDAAATLAIRNGTNAQAFRVYNTSTSSNTNYERGKIAWETDILRIGTEKGGTSNARAMEFQTDGTTRLTIASTGKLTIPTNVELGFGVSSIVDSGGSLFVSSQSSAPVIIRNGSTVSVQANGSLLQFGGSTSSFPALKRDGTTLRVRLADDSGDAPLSVSELRIGTTTVTVNNIWTGLINTGTLRSSTTETKLLGTAGFGWVASNVTSETIDTALWRDAANNLAQRNGTNAQTFRVYNTSSSANANYERGKLEWASDVFRIGTEKGGTGTTARAMEFQTDGTTRITLAASSNTVTFAGSLTLGTNASVFSASGRISFGSGSSGLLGVNSSPECVTIRSSGVLGFVSGTDVGNTDAVDVRIARDGAGILAQRSGTNAQTFNIYNTYTSSTNYERLSIEAQSGASVRIRTNKGSGGGTAQALELGTDATTALTLTTAQKAEFAATIKTAAPTGGTAAEWKLGTVASVSPTSPDRTIEVEIGGTIYYVHAKTTNN